MILSVIFCFCLVSTSRPVLGSLNYPPVPAVLHYAESENETTVKPEFPADEDISVADFKDQVLESIESLFEAIDDRNHGLEVLLAPGDLGSDLGPSTDSVLFVPGAALASVPGVSEVSSQATRYFRCNKNERQVTKIDGDQGQYCCVGHKSGETRTCQRFSCQSETADNCCTARDTNEKFCRGFSSSFCKDTERKFGAIDTRMKTGTACCITPSNQQRFCQMSRCIAIYASCCQTDLLGSEGICNGYVDQVAGGVAPPSGNNGAGTPPPSNGGGYGGNGFGSGGGNGSPPPEAPTSGYIDYAPSKAPKGKNPKTTMAPKQGKGKTNKPSPTVPYGDYQWSTPSAESLSTSGYNTDYYTKPDYGGGYDACLEQRNKLLEEFKLVTKNMIANSKEQNTRQGDGSSTVAPAGSIVNVLARIPGQVVDALSSTFSRTIGKK